MEVWNIFKWKKTDGVNIHKCEKSLSLASSFSSFILLLMWNTFFSLSFTFECSMFGYFSFFSPKVFLMPSFWMASERHAILFQILNQMGNVFQKWNTTNKNLYHWHQHGHEHWIQWLNATNEKKWPFVNRSKLFALCFIMFAFIVFSFYVFLFSLFDCITFHFRFVYGKLNAASIGQIPYIIQINLPNKHTI